MESTQQGEDDPRCAARNDLACCEAREIRLTAHEHALPLPQGAVSAAGGAEIFISALPVMEAVLTCPSETRSIGWKSPHP